ncbi:putative ATPase N2B [Armadillidium nasatum]|uniref:Putative ATPase N2B n=1 Tax=Armadillidium nasatum TaxID=96803 RepID=A0A5N5TNZ8_9CRUS|nr:putative ATPase N2B [Armadillidium nasatum]
MKKFLNRNSFKRPLVFGHLFSTLPKATVNSKSNNAETPVQVYSQKIASQQLLHDKFQELIVTDLDNLYKEIKPYVPPSPPGFFKKFLGLTSNVESPQGLYIWGTVGTGKTMLMDLFYDCCSVDNKKRVHFNSFMLDVHDRIHKEKKNIKKIHAPDQARYFEPDGTYTIKLRPYDPIAPVAQSIAQESWLICFDEFQVINLDSGVDYRTKKSTGEDTYFVKSECDADAEVQRIFKILASKENDIIRPRTLTYHNRSVTYERTCGQIIDCAFSELCERPLGASDYLQMSRFFHTVIIRDIPILNQLSKSAAKRFITLIDTLYDNKVRLICTSDVPHTEIFREMSSNKTIVPKEDLVLMDDLGLKEKQEGTKNINIFTGEEEIFASERTVSRLGEMMTQEYWALYDSRQR